MTPPRAQGRSAELAERRRQLQQLAAAQRRELGSHLDAIETRVRGVDQGFVKVRSLLQRPLLLTGGSLLAMFVGPWRALRLVGKAMPLIITARRLFGI